MLLGNARRRKDKGRIILKMFDKESVVSVAAVEVAEVALTAVRLFETRRLLQGTTIAVIPAHHLVGEPPHHPEITTEGRRLGEIVMSTFLVDVVIATMIIGGVARHRDARLLLLMLRDPTHLVLDAENPLHALLHQLESAKQMAQGSRISLHVVITARALLSHHQLLAHDPLDALAIDSPPDHCRRHLPPITADVAALLQATAVHLAADTPQAIALAA